MKIEAKLATVPPTYKQLLEEIGRQLSQRKSALLKRVLLITWPFLLLVVTFFLLGKANGSEGSTYEQVGQWIFPLIVYVLAAVIYSSVVRFIFDIEKRIWIDSFFDQKNLALSDSWKLAKKIFWDALIFRLKIFVRYYFIPIAAVILLEVIVIYISTIFFKTTEARANIIIVSSISFVVLLIGLLVYSYYIRTKLRYAWFIFLDKFGPNYSHSSVIEEMLNLNKISESEAFKKSLILSIGTDSINGLAQSVVGIISRSMSNLGDVGNVLGGVLSVYGNEASRQVTDFGNISANYILYRFARKETHGSEQDVNEYLYGVLSK